jgi:integrase
MARQIGRLTALQIKRAKPGWHSDGGGLYLQVDKDGGRYWFFRWGAAGAKYASLGPTHTISLQQAREKARACRGLLIEGRDPKTQRAAARLEALRQVSFSQVAEQYFNNHKAAWSEKHVKDWPSRMRRYVEPIFGPLPVSDIDTVLVLKVLEPLWHVKTHTANKLRGAIEAILDFAKARGLREGENSARWRGHLENLLPSMKKIAPVKHYAALPYAEMPAFMTKLRTMPSTSARCLELIILTAVRTNEARCAVWEEIDGDTWTIPGVRMKAGRVHRVPLSRAACRVLDQMRQKQRGVWVFPGRPFRGRDVPINKQAVIKELLWKFHPGITVHGFRSTFRDWVAERTDFSGEVAEMALAHTIKNETEAAYRRGDLLHQRRKMMETWANFCGATGDVILIRKMDDPAAGTETRLVRIPDAICNRRG